MNDFNSQIFHPYRFFANKTNTKFIIKRFKQYINGIPIYDKIDNDIYTRDNIKSAIAKYTQLNATYKDEEDNIFDKHINVDEIKTLDVLERALYSNLNPSS